MAKIFYILLFISSFYTVSAQQISITGKVIDSNTKNIIPYATIAIYKNADSSMIDFRLSNDKGDFKIPAVPLNVKIRMIVTFVGMQTVKREFLFTENSKVLDIGSIMLEPSQVNLNEIVVTSEIPPVIVRNDAIEFNASSFKQHIKMVLQ